MVRLVIAAACVWFFAGALGTRLALLRLEALPDLDIAAEVRHLRLAGRLSEAELIGDEGLASMLEHGASTEELKRVRRERDLAREQRHSVVRRLRDAGWGAITGQGDTLESLLGVVAADFFIVGDVRDLAIQGTKLAIDGETDEVILALSAVGLATTVVPEVDWAASVLKAARKAGAMSEGLARFVSRQARAGSDGIAALRALLADVAVLARRGSPAWAVRLLKHIDDPADAKAVARFVEKHPAGSGAIVALHVTGGDGVKVIAAGAGEGLEAAARAEELVMRAGRKGAVGRAFLTTSAAKRALKPHALVGVTKGLWKGTAARAIERLAAAAGQRVWWLLPAALAWAAAEAILILRRVLLVARTSQVL